MKNYRSLVPIGMVALMGLSWYSLIGDAWKVEAEYNNYLTQARKYAEDGITKYAIENYMEAIAINSTPEVYAEVANYYKEQDDPYEYLYWCEDFFEEYPTESLAYDCLLEAYLKDEDYESCYDILEVANKRNVSSETIESIQQEIMYKYKFDYNTYEDVGVYSNYFSPVKKDEKWGFVNRYGDQRISCKYLEVGAFTNSGFASVVSLDNEAYFIDTSGDKVMVSEEQYTSFGLLSNDVIPAKRTDGKYVYLNTDFNVVLGEYDYASTMNYDIAAVKIGDEWQLINESGEAISEEKYLDVKLDEKQIAYRNDRLFVSKESGKYIMIDSKGNQIGSLEFEDAHIFTGDYPAAVKLNGKWCFIDKNGERISDKEYDDARSFSNELAAVCIAGEWGFVDLGENVVIDTQFYDAKDFNEKGSCFVKTGDIWQLLKLYRLNREDS